MAVTDDESWTRIRHEGVRAFQAFTIYLQMGPERSITKVARELSKSRTLIGRWSAAHQWTERVAAWDAHIHRLEMREREKAVKQANANHVKLSQAMQGRIAETLNLMAKAKDKDGKPAPFGPAPEDVPKWVDTAVKIERLGLGMSTANVEHAGKDGQAIKLDVLQQARERLAEKLAPIDAELSRANAEAAAKDAAEHSPEVAEAPEDAL